nr:recombinase [Bacillus thuringiensis]
MFGKAEITKKQTRNYVLSPEQYQEVTKQVNVAVTIKKDYESLKKIDFVKENESLKMHTEGWMKENRTLKQEKKQLQKEVGVLNREKSSYKGFADEYKSFCMYTRKKFLRSNLRRLEGLLKKNWIVRE